MIDLLGQIKKHQTNSYSDEYFIQEIYRIENEIQNKIIGDPFADKWDYYFKMGVKTISECNFLNDCFKKFESTTQLSMDYTPPSDGYRSTEGYIKFTLHNPHK